MNSNFWRRFFYIGLFSLIAYLLIGCTVWISTVLHYEINLLPVFQRQVIPASKDSGSYGTVATYIQNVFGDPIPYAVVYVDGRIAQADNNGFFKLEGLFPARYTLQIFAGGYQSYKWEITVEEGINEPVIKYDTGLWPEYFLGDFHILSNVPNKLFPIVGLANGSEQTIYVQKAIIHDASLKPLLDLMAIPDIIEYFSSLSSKVTIVNEPLRALKIPPKLVISGNVPPIAVDKHYETYFLEIHFGTEREHEKQEYQITRINTKLDTSGKWNPHLP